MKILYHHRTQAEDGQAVHIRALQRAFVEEGHEVVEYALVKRAPSSQATAATPATAGTRLPAAAPERPRRRLSPWAVLARSPRFVRELAEYAYGPLARSGLIRAGQIGRADFLYERYAFGNTAGVAAARRLRVPLVLEVNSPMVLELERTRGLSLKRTAERIERWVFQSADLVCVVTGVLRDMLVDMGVARERLLVTPNGVHLEAYPERTPQARAQARRALGLPEEASGPLLGFVGFVRDWHRLDLVVRALASTEFASAHLVVVGEGPALEGLRAEARRGGVDARLHCTGARPHDEVPALLAAFDVALVPAINPYASPLKLLEYMAAALPVVAPDQPNLREVLAHEENALLVAPGDAQALTAALARLCRDAELARRLGQAARATVVGRDLSWRANARAIVSAVAALPRWER